MAKSLTIAAIQRAAAAHFEIPLDCLTVQTRLRDYVRARQVAYWLCRQLTERSGSDIARAFQRSHATVLYGIAVIDGLIAAGDLYGEEAIALEAKLKGHKE